MLSFSMTLILTCAKPHADNLDTALVRNGRVDLHIQFTHATSEQMSSLFTQFYPSAGRDKAEAFSKAVTAALGGRGVNMCALQHYFIDQRESSADDAITNVKRIAEDLDEKEMGKKKELEEEEKGKEDKEAKKEGDSKDVAAKGKNPGKAKNKNKKNAGGPRNKGRSSHRGNVYVFVNSGSAPKGGCKSDSESESSEREEEEKEKEECSAEGSEAGSETGSDSGSDSE
jgi:chaperone BCS1